MYNLILNSEEMGNNPDILTLNNCYQCHKDSANYYKIASCVPGNLMSFSRVDFLHGIKSIPVGSIKFIQTALVLTTHQNDYMLHSKLEVPAELRKPEFLGRKYYVGALQGRAHIINSKKRYFVKTLTPVHSQNAIVQGTHISESKAFGQSDIIISEVLDILSEWRVFVFRGHIVNVACYRINKQVASPDLKNVQKMIDTMLYAPPAYVIDVAVTSSGTFVLEVYNFLGVELYSTVWDDTLLAMFVKGYEWEITYGTQYRLQKDFYYPRKI